MCMRTLRRGESEEIRGAAAVQGEHGHPVQGFGGYAMGADLEEGRWCENSLSAMGGEEISRSGSANGQCGHCWLREWPISLAAPEKRPLWRLDIKNAFLQSDGFDREVHLRATCE